MTADVAPSADGRSRRSAASSRAANDRSALRASSSPSPPWIARSTVYICDECIGLCNDIIAEEIDRGSSKTPETVRLRIERLLGDEARAAEELSSYSARSVTDVPEPVKRAISSLGAASEALRTAVQRWSPEEPAAVESVPAWLEPAVAELTRIEELALALRHALERELAPEQMLAFDRLLGLLPGLRKTLILNARAEEAGRQKEPSGRSD
jgi:hypothetical protein